MMSTSQIGRYAAIPGQVVVNGLLAMMGKETRFHGRYVVVPDDVDEYNRGRSEVALSMSLWMLHILWLVLVTMTASALMEWISNETYLLLGLAAVTGGLLGLICTFWYDPEAIRESDTEVV